MLAYCFAPLHCKKSFSTSLESSGPWIFKTEEDGQVSKSICSRSNMSNWECYFSYKKLRKILFPFIKQGLIAIYLDMTLVKNELCDFMYLSLIEALQRGIE